MGIYSEGKKSEPFSKKVDGWMWTGVILLSGATSVILPIASAFTFVILLLERWPGERDRVGS